VESSVDKTKENKDFIPTFSNNDGQKEGIYDKKIILFFSSSYTLIIEKTKCIIENQQATLS